MSAAPATDSEISTGPEEVVGVDTNKHTHKAVALDANGGWLGSLKLEAKRSGYEELIRWDAEFRSSPVFAAEGTGCYCADLCRTLHHSWYRGGQRERARIYPLHQPCS